MDPNENNKDNERRSRNPSSQNQTNNNQTQQTQNNSSSSNPSSLNTTTASISNTQPEYSHLINLPINIFTSLMGMVQIELRLRSVRRHFNPLITEEINLGRTILLRMFRNDPKDPEILPIITRDPSLVFNVTAQRTIR